MESAREESRRRTTTVNERAWIENIAALPYLLSYCLLLLAAHANYSHRIITRTFVTVVTCMYLCASVCLSVCLPVSVCEQQKQRNKKIVCDISRVVRRSKSKSTADAFIIVMIMLLKF